MEHLDESVHKLTHISSKQYINLNRRPDWAEQQTRHNGRGCSTLTSALLYWMDLIKLVMESVSCC